MSYSEAKEYVREINIKTKKDFFQFALSEDKPETFPLNPNKVYKEWTGWEDFLGVESLEEVKPSKSKKAETALFFRRFEKFLGL